jgi:ABC-2 type transport system ATP-binding protein/fluoroquinolone transport system ATP-binding protein
MVLVVFDCRVGFGVNSVKNKIFKMVEQTQPSAQGGAKRKVGWRGMIAVKNLTFSYENGRQALHGLDFMVEDGEVFGFLGPNGSGKSTTQKILTGILTGYGGSVSLFERDFTTIQRQAFFQKIGVLFEFPYLYTNLSAVDNLKYFSLFYPREQLRDIDELIDLLEIKRDFVKKPVSSYSKGMRQRTSMARALLNNPKLLFLDEPTSGLDPTGAVLFRRIIEQERSKGTTIFLTTHNMLDADLLCDRVAFLTDGRIAALDTPKNLKEKNSSRNILVEYLHQGQRKNQILKPDEVGKAFSFLYDEILQVHSQEPTLEDIFLQYTGRGLQ